MPLPGFEPWACGLWILLLTAEQLSQTNALFESLSSYVFVAWTRTQDLMNSGVFPSRIWRGIEHRTSVESESDHLGDKNAFFHGVVVRADMLYLELPWKNVFFSKPPSFFQAFSNFPFVIRLTILFLRVLPPSYWGNFKKDAKPDFTKKIFLRKYLGFPTFCALKIFEFDFLKTQSPQYDARGRQMAVRS